jgi:hypothetical protein
VLDIWLAVNESTRRNTLRHIGASLRQGIGQGKSRVSVVLPADPICYHEVGRRRDQEERKILVMRVEQEGVESLGKLLDDGFRAMA